MTYRVIPYRVGSAGAKALATALQGRVLKLQGSRYVRKARDTIINWGNTDPPYVDDVLNGRGIRTASNKLAFFQRVAGRGEVDIIPTFWTDRASIPDDAFPIVCRTVLAGHSGEGIVIANTRADLVPAPLYVRYIKKKHEYRIHVGRITDNAQELLENRLTIISEQKKVKRADVENANFQIRNHANGFIFQRHGIVVPESVRDVARRALACTDLDFGAADVIFNEREGRPYVLEINTAPGLEGQTVTDYANFFRSL